MAGSNEGFSCWAIGENSHLLTQISLPNLFKEQQVSAVLKMEYIYVQVF